MSINDTIMERVTTGVAVGAAGSPIWLPSLKQWSEVAALILPILGVVWLVVQLVAFFAKRGK